EALRESRGTPAGTYAVRCPERRVWNGGDRKTICLDISIGISGIGKCSAPGASKAIRKSPIITTLSERGIGSGSPRGREWHTVASGKDQSQLPATQGPLCGGPETAWTGNLPNSVEYEGATHIEIRQTAAQPLVEPVQARDRVTECIPRYRG